jgi:hypothetical protein
MLKLLPEQEGKNIRQDLVGVGQIMHLRVMREMHDRGHGKTQLGMHLHHLPMITT